MGNLTLRFKSGQCLVSIIATNEGNQYYVRNTTVMLCSLRYHQMNTDDVSSSEVL